MGVAMATWRPPAEGRLQRLLLFLLVSLLLLLLLLCAFTYPQTRASPTSSRPIWPTTWLTWPKSFTSLTSPTSPTSPKLKSKVRGRMAIVKGRPVEDHRYFAYQVAILYDGELTCGGSIISPSYILTAAHCFGDYSKNNKDIGSDTEHVSLLGGSSWKLNEDPNATSDYWDIAFGSANLLAAGNPNLTVVRAAELWISSDYIMEGRVNGSGSIAQRVSNDIAIVRLAQPISFSSTKLNVRPISLSPDEAYLESGHDLTISGWGSLLTSSEGPMPSTLQAVTVDHLLNDCNAMFKDREYNFIPEMNLSMWYDQDEVICAGCSESTAGICSGDSGSPLAVLSIQGGCPVQVGVASWSVDINHTFCGMGRADWYTRASRKLPWIESVVRQPLRSTVVPMPVHSCETCSANVSGPIRQECKRAHKYDLEFCDFQARLASSFVLDQPTCEGGNHILKAYIDFKRGFFPPPMAVPPAISPPTSTTPPMTLPASSIPTASSASASASAASSSLQQPAEAAAAAASAIAAAAPASEVEEVVEEEEEKKVDEVEQLKRGSVIFLHTDRGLGNSRIAMNLSQTQNFTQQNITGAEKITMINTPLKEPWVVSSRVAFNAQEGTWTHLVPGCSPNSTYAALYVLDSLMGRPSFYQISLPVGRVLLQEA